MAYDEDLAKRVRDQLTAEHGLTQKAMFGGPAFQFDGNIVAPEGFRGDGELRAWVAQGVAFARSLPAKG